MRARASISQGQLQANLLQLKAKLLQNGIIAADAAPISLQNFANAPQHQQQLILSNISTYLQILSQDPQTDVSTPSYKTEMARLKNVMKAMNLRPADDDVYSYLREDDVIEIYSEAGFQLYRNVNFCKICSYNLLDLAVNPWSKLYEKPNGISEKIQKAITQVMTDDSRTIPYDIEPFIQREKFTYGKTLKTYLATPRYISPLFDKASNRPTAFISTYSAELIAEGDASLKLNIL